MDNRIVTVGIEVKGKMLVYGNDGNLPIKAQGNKETNSNKNDCNIQITNLPGDVIDYLVTSTSPFNKNKQRNRIVISCGRESYGTSQVYTGDIVSAVPSGPPDVVLNIKCQTGGFAAGKIVQRKGSALTKLSEIAKWAAEDNGLILEFLIPDRNIANYSYSGSAAAAIRELEQLASLAPGQTFVDDNELIVKPTNSARSERVRVLRDIDMILPPNYTEKGLICKFLWGPHTQLGGRIKIESEKYPDRNGLWTPYKLGFDVSNRDNNFYYIAECSRL